MRRRQIDISLGEIDTLPKRIQEIKADIERKTRQLTEELSQIGLREAQIRFTSAVYDEGSSANDVVVSVESTDNGWVIRARGRAVCFIEFGAGVFYNPSEPYPGRPPGILQIGEYGKGYGKRKAWGYTDDTGHHVTHGTPAQMPMYYAANEMERQIINIARRVFDS